MANDNDRPPAKSTRMARLSSTPHHSLPLFHRSSRDTSGDTDGRGDITSGGDIDDDIINNNGDNENVSNENTDGSAINNDDTKCSASDENSTDGLDDKYPYLFAIADDTSKTSTTSATPFGGIILPQVSSVEQDTTAPVAVYSTLPVATKSPDLAVTHVFDEKIRRVHGRILQQQHSFEQKTDTKFNKLDAKIDNIGDLITNLTQTLRIPDAPTSATTPPDDSNERSNASHLKISAIALRRG